MRSAKGLMARGVLALGAVLLTLVAVETFLRLVVGPVAIPEAPFRATAVAEESQGQRSAVKGILHPYRGWSEVPAAHWSQDLEAPRRNIHGLASTIRDYRQLPRDDFVIGVFGGSVALHLANRAGDVLVASLIEARPELAGRVRIVNAAEGGYKQPQQLMLLSELLVLGVPFDVVVNLDGYNEAALGLDNATQGVHPVLPHYSHIEGVQRLRAENPSEEDLLAAATIITLRRRSEARRRWLVESPLARLYLLRAWGVRELARSENEATEQELALTKSRDKEQLSIQLPDRCLEKPASCERLIARIWSSSSRAMDGITRRHGIRYIHFLQPNQHLEGTKPLSDEEREHFYNPRRIWNRGYRQVAPRLQRHGQLLAQEGVDFVDLTELFIEHPETLYLDTCCHLNERGNGLLAKAVSGYIARDLSLSPSVGSRDED